MRSTSFHLLLLLTARSLTYGQLPTLEQITSYPFPDGLTAAAKGSRIAWAVNEAGKRNLYVAEGPSFAPRKLTNFTADDGQELTSIALTSDGSTIVFVRGGDHGANWDPGLPVNPTFSPTPPKVQVWSISFSGGANPKLIGDGDRPRVSPDGATVAFLRAGQVFTAPVDGSQPAKGAFTTRGTVSEIEWSPDSKSLAFVTNRGDHSLIGVYRSADTPIAWIAPSFARDRSPRWSPDGSRIAFVRSPGAGGAPQAILEPRHQPWSIWTADVSGAAGSAKKLWSAPETLRGSAGQSAELHWAALGRIVFLSYQDGWQHLYSIPESGASTEPLLLTKGNFMVENVKLSSDRTTLIFAANAGKDPMDIDRRHIVRASVDKAGIEVLTPGEGIEAEPVITGDGSTIAFFSATATRPSVLAIRKMTGGPIQLAGASMVPAGVPWDQLVTPKQVVYKSSDGVTVHAQLFERPGGAAKKPGIVFVHGGPQRQMLLGWHYMDYYTNSYAMNQYLAMRGFTVLSVNYRLGIGYGYDFHRPPHSGAQGAAEYLDVKAGAEWLARQPGIDAAKIGIYGGSYGGFLTAMAIAKDSKLFAAGVDIHGVHDWTGQRGRGEAGGGERFEKVPDQAKALELAFKSSPVASVSGWKSPVLFIHGDDDRNVQFSQSTDLIRRLDALKVSYEMLVIVDDTHHFMRHANQFKVDQAIVEFLERKLMGDEGIKPSRTFTPADH